MESSIVPLKPRPASDICGACQNLDFFRSVGFAVEYKTDELEKLSRTCDLCSLFWRTYLHNSASESSTVRFEKVQSSLRMNGIAAPVLTLCRSLGTPAQCISKRMLGVNHC
jgi:hypothetical protein